MNSFPPPLPNLLASSSSLTHHVAHGKCLDVMRTLPTCRLDAVVTDPPYGIGFKRSAWDSELPSVAELREIHRLLKPGAYLLAFSSSRTYHRLATRVEDAGFTIHPMLAWLFGTGFPKARKLEIEGLEHWRYGLQALKPAMEPIVMAQKPISESNMSRNVERWRTGAINIHACRVASNDGVNVSSDRSGEASANRTYRDQGATDFGLKPGPRGGAPEGRWPANVLHDGSEQVMESLPEASGARGSSSARHHCTLKPGRVYNGVRPPLDQPARGDAGSAARFFYCAKPTQEERNEACENTHPTVKPIALMRWLIQLVTPRAGTILDPWCGSGTTGCAAVEMGYGFIGIEQDINSVEIARKRIDATNPGLSL